jgi:hypothetical protein
MARALNMVCMIPSAFGMMLFLPHSQKQMLKEDIVVWMSKNDQVYIKIILQA